jgi:quercetin dioxygenase-like cupin family protein
MNGKFRMANEIHEDDVDRAIRWICHAASTGATRLTVLEGTLAPGQAHGFHKHPEQEEVLYVVAGTIELWIETEKRVLGVGDAAFLPAGTVHASFNTSKDDAKLLAILGPSVGAGFDMVDVSAEPPWSEARA